MKKNWLAGLLVGASLLQGYHIAAQEHDAKREPLTFALECAGGDCPLLKGVPQTSGMRGGSVRLKPGESVGWHSTGQNEEALTILRGSGTANIEGHADVPIHANMLAYISPATRHNVTNTGSEILEYVWVVAPVAAK
ncbi:MAG: cupin domain-containing protein [Candidatus Acidiferrum sp.]